MNNEIIKFSFEENDDNIIVIEENSGKVFPLNDENSVIFPNRKIRLIEGIQGNALLCDGYSVWAKGNLKLEDYSHITISLWILPVSFDNNTAIISNFNSVNSSGFEITCNRFGQLEFSFGDGNNIYKTNSKRHCIKTGQWSHITVAFDSNVGWAYLYVNGVEITRYQTPPHIKIKAGSEKIYIGRSQEARSVDEHICLDVFDGAINNIKIYNIALNKYQIYKNYYNDLSHHGNSIPFMSKGLLSLDRKYFDNDIQRPKYHLIAPGKWMNEPHSPIFFKDYYHIFYQANPHAPIWNNIKWGHMISKDMIRWTDLPIALDTDENDFDHDGCWSGSCCYDEKGIPVIFYTAGNNELMPNQMIAMAKSDYMESGDSRLEKWTRYPEILIKQSQEMGWFGEFRDPFVWREKNQWFMLVGSGTEDNTGGNAIIFTSLDMVSWTHHGNIMEYDYNICKEVGQVWELPVLLPLRNLEGEIKKHIFIFCSCSVEDDVVETYYFIGSWDSKNKKFIKDHEKPKLFDLGNGTFTGSCGFVTPDNRSIIFTISQGKREFYEEFTSGWAHNGGMPIELFLNTDNTLGIRPIKEVKSLRGKKVLHFENTTLSKINEELKCISGNMFEINLEVEDEKIGIAVLHGEDHITKIKYDNKSEKYLAFSNDKVISKYRGSIDKVPIQKDIKLNCFLDHSMLECYINECKGITLRNYSTIAKRQIRLEGKEDAQIKYFEIWEMESAY